MEHILARTKKGVLWELDYPVIGGPCKVLVVLRPQQFILQNGIDSNSIRRRGHSLNLSMAFLCLRSTADAATQVAADQELRFGQRFVIMNIAYFSAGA